MLISLNHFGASRGFLWCVPPRYTNLWNSSGCCRPLKCPFILSSVLTTLTKELFLLPRNESIQSLLPRIVAVREHFSHAVLEFMGSLHSKGQVVGRDLTPKAWHKLWGLPLSRDVGSNKSLIITGIVWDIAWEIIWSSCKVFKPCLESDPKWCNEQQSVLAGAWCGCLHKAPLPMILLWYFWLRGVIEHLVMCSENCSTILDKTKLKRPFCAQLALTPVPDPNTGNQCSTSTRSS